MEVKTYILRTHNGLIDPSMLAKMRDGRFDGNTVILDDNSIVLLGTKFVFVNKENNLEPGTAVRVWLSNNFTCASLSNIESYNQEREVARLLNEQQEKARMNAYRDESAVFNSSLPIPVKWCTGVKQVLSGLSGKSWGDGRMRSSVEHVYLLEDLKVGRIKRNKYDFLCSNSKSRLGGLHFETFLKWVDGDGNHYEPKVTCKKCLTIVERMRIK